MSTELIPTFQGFLNGSNQLLCNARDLHQFLGVSKDFSSWIKDRIEQCRFQPSRDYLLTKIGEQVPHQGGVRSVQKLEYHLTMYASEHIAMMAKTEIGFQIRDYFIRMRDKAMLAIPSAQMVHEYGLMSPDALLTPEEKALLLSARKDWLFINQKTLEGWTSQQIADKLSRDDSGVRKIIGRQRRAHMLPPDPRRIALRAEKKLLDYYKAQQAKQS